MSIKAIGIDKIEYGTYGDGVPPTSWTELTDVIVEDSVILNFPEPSETVLKSETSKHPFHTIREQSDTPDSIEFQLYAPAAATLELLMGGTATGDKWEEPTEIPEINKSWKITTKTNADSKYVEYTIVNGSVFARFSTAPGKRVNEIVLVKINKEAAITSGGTENTAFIREIKTAT